MNTIKRTDLPAPGTAIEGGFFAGVININGEHFGVVVGPKSTELTGQWGKFGEQSEATSAVDGLANTEAMAREGSEIANQVRALTANDLTDWYIPARDELELAYRNLKPTAEENFCSFRDGDNPGSVPPRCMYTKQDPAQTECTAFQDGQPEAFAAAWYWSSTQYSAYGAFFQAFSDGDQFTNDKGDRGRVRAVRRFKVID